MYIHIYNGNYTTLGGFPPTQFGIMCISLSAEWSSEL